MRPVMLNSRRVVTQGLLMCFVVLLCSSVSSGQQTNDVQTIDKDTLKLLLNRIDELEARVKQLEEERKNADTLNATRVSTSSNPPSTATTSAAPVLPAARPVAPKEDTSRATQETAAEVEQSQPESAMSDRMDLSKTLLRIRGFGDISLHGDTQKGDVTAFTLGQLDLFVTSDISDKFKFLGEIVFEAGADDFYGVVQSGENEFGVDIERYLLQYSLNDYFNLSVGRGHTSIGYYNTAYHHSTWLQTTTGRPFLFNFEDEGGILPVHIVGATASGRVPSGRLGLHYVAEVGNGRESRFPLTEQPVQNVTDDQTHKAFNLAIFSRPQAVQGLQTGFSYYNDLLSPANSPRIGESILAAHAVLIRPKYEWLNEALLIRHSPFGTATTFNTPGFYTQVSEQFGAFRPYFRYQYVNASNREPVFPTVGLQHGPSLGLRFDASESVALKFQYDYSVLRNQPGVSGLNLQVGFTF